MGLNIRLICLIALINALKAEDLQDFEFSEPNELLIAQESRQYETIVKPPVRILKPSGVTNSHRPQYNLDSLEADLTAQLDDYFESTSKRPVVKNYKIKMSKEGMIRDAVLRALERKDHVGKFAQILPIIRAMSGNQRVALASLVASQVTTPPGRQPLNLSQVRSMFNNNNTSDLMLPILLDTANLIRRAIRPGKEPREVNYPQTHFQRRSFTEDSINDDTFDTEDQENQPSTSTQNILQKHRNFRNRSQRITQTANAIDEKHVQDINKKVTNNTQSYTNENPKNTVNTLHDIANGDNRTVSFSTTESNTKNRHDSISRSDNGTTDLTADATNQTVVQDLPIAEKFRSLNRYMDRKGNLIRRGTYMPKISPPTRRTTAEPALAVMSRRRPAPGRKLPSTTEQAKCELFTNTLCLHTDDYPADAIISSIRRNKAAAGALLADFKDPGEGAVDGITPAQEAKYTAEHYLVSNRRGDTANRDFASAGEAGFMCPSTVKYARPQRARATSGQWKYIVNTGEHTQTLRLEKCLKPKESCTYLTDNFKSKCVQVYNYHRLLTWDQQNGLHMDIFKVPTCCSCHIEGYSVSFPPLGHRMHETSSEHFPGEDLSSEHGNQAFESVQSSIQRPSLSKTPFNLNKPIAVDSFPTVADSHNSILESAFNNAKLNDNEEFNNVPSSSIDSYGHTYFPDSFNQASSVRNSKRPVPRNPSGLAALESVTLPSYLEPPTPAAPSSFSFSKDSFNKYKAIDSQFKRGPIRPSRRPIRKKISTGPEDLVSSGTSAIGAYDFDSSTDFNEDLEDTEINVNTNFNPRVTISPKLQAVTPERNFTIFKPFDQSKIGREESTNGKKINYNYHPIIDFFEDDDKNQDSIDREDNVHTYVASSESEWKPINRPLMDSKTTNSIGRKKHK
ncbi:neurotrophin 1-like [Maniola hyperantus]|uniref:neurotrophin 1-like n=1 Tax=Aphantopus hyperantus TaxID=2795564 RepID=UPI001567D8FD|nr:neurotrophin 1 [Maniola hyperantus]